MLLALAKFKDWNLTAWDRFVGSILIAGGVGVGVAGFVFVASQASGLYLLLAIIPFVCAYLQVHNGLSVLTKRVTDATGTARMGTLSDLKKARLIDRRPGPPRTRDIYTGTFKFGWFGWFKRRCYYSGPGHGVTTGPPRSGKDARFLVDNITHLTERSMLIMDPKAELAAITANHRRKSGPVIIINPFGVLTKTLPHLKSCGFNPLTGIDPDDGEFASNCAGVGEALVQIEDGKNRHWSLRARSLVSALVMGAKILEKEGKGVATIGLVSSMLSYPYKTTNNSEPSLYKILKKISEYPDPEHPDDQVADKARGFIDESETPSNELRDVIATARGQLDFLNDRMLRDDLSRHPTVNGEPFDFKMLKDYVADRKKKKQVITVYMVLPAKKLVTHAGWLRLLVSNALNSLSDVPGPVRPIIMLNEIGNLGHIQPLVTGMGMAAGMGITIWTIWQSLAQIIEIYGPQGFQMFMGGAGFFNALAPKDLETARYLSEFIGDGTKYITSRSENKPGPGGSSATPTSLPVIYADQIRGMAEGEALAFMNPSPLPFKVHAPGYWEWIKGLDANPWHVERKA